MGGAVSSVGNVVGGVGGAVNNVVQRVPGVGPVLGPAAGIALGQNPLSAFGSSLTGQFINNSGSGSGSGGLSGGIGGRNQFAAPQPFRPLEFYPVFNRFSGYQQPQTQQPVSQPEMQQPVPQPEMQQPALQPVLQQATPPVQGIASLPNRSGIGGRNQLAAPQPQPLQYRPSFSNFRRR